MNTERKSNSYQNVFTRGSIALIEHGFNDYTYNETFLLDRIKADFKTIKWVEHKVEVSKLPLVQLYNIGMSNSFAASLNVEFDLPLPKFLPLGILHWCRHIFYVQCQSKRQNNTIYNSGLYLNLFKFCISMYQ